MPAPDPAIDPRAVAGAHPVDPNMLRVEETWFVGCVERLFAGYEHVHPLPVILAVARQCRAELEGSGPPPSALPELVERLARHRLGATSAQDTVTWQRA